MLHRPTEAEALAWLEPAWRLAQDPSRSGYPIYHDGIKTHQDFHEACRKGLEDPRRTVLLYTENGSTAGWIQFTYLEEDLYLQTEIFSISGSTEQALSEFTAFCQDHYPGVSLYLGFPGENTRAIGWLSENGWTCLERSYHDILLFSRYNLRPVNPNVVRVTRENFGDFRILHQPIEEEMYWNSARLYDDLDNWEIYLYYREEKPAGAIYYTDEGTQAEIFGVDFAEGRFDETVFRTLLTTALNACKQAGKEYMVYFNDEESQRSALACGFTCVGQYVLHIRQV